VEERFDRIDRRFDTPESRADGLTVEVRDLKNDVSTLKTDVSGLRADIADLRRYMDVLHEDALSRIKVMNEKVEASINARMDRRFDELRDLILNRVISRSR
jgi:hypothetical protein